MVNDSKFDVGSPGLFTFTCATPTEAMSPAGTAAVNCVALTNVVVSAAPFHCTTEPETKPEPFAVTVSAPVPATAVDGDSEVSTGALTGGLLVSVSSITSRKGDPELTTGK